MTLSSDERERRLNRCCKTCGDRMNSLDARKVTCSVECGFEGRRQDKVAVDCVVCGESVQRYKKAVDSQSMFCCSRTCQLHWALKENHSSKLSVKSCAVIKRDWYLAQSAERRSKSLKSLWWNRCIAVARGLAIRNSEKTTDEWVKRCASAASCLGNRAVVFGVKGTEDCSENLNSSLLRKWNNLKAKTILRQTSGWKQKCLNAHSSMKNRLSH